MARILWLPPGLLQSSTRSFTPTCAGHGVPTGVRSALHLIDVRFAIGLAQQQDSRAEVNPVVFAERS
jgi:hypothetical protein